MKSQILIHAVRQLIDFIFDEIIISQQSLSINKKMLIITFFYDTILYEVFIMKKIFDFFKKDITFTIAGILAMISAFFVVPDKEYISYINFPVLVLLFCLMIIVSGFEKTGLFDILKSKLMSGIKSEKGMIFTLSMLCFFSSALITNDVALITFVPFSLLILKNQKSYSVIFCVVMETISANLGSLLTPIGNPQNLYLYKTFALSIGEFFKITIPLGILCLLMICIFFIFSKNDTISSETNVSKTSLNKSSLTVFSLLFILCILSVLDIISCYITFGMVVLGVFFTDKKLFFKVDYILLLTFVFFFIFSGNIKRIPFIYDFISHALSLNEVIVTALICQVISNVPAAAMLSSFTDNATSLILGTNIGGLGTIIASMASLISYRYISVQKNINSSKYLLIFSIYNFIMLAVLLFIYR